jgi:hypothetical protein
MQTESKKLVQLFLFELLPVQIALDFTNSEDELDSKGVREERVKNLDDLPQEVLQKLQKEEADSTCSDLRSIFCLAPL